MARLLRGALRRTPDNPRTWRKLASLLLDLGDTQAAFSCLEDALARLPDNIDLRRLRILFEIRAGDLGAALAEARALWEAHPRDPGAGQSLLEALKASRLWDEQAARAQEMPWLIDQSRYSLEGLARRTLVLGDDPGELLSSCSAILARSPAHTHATFYKAVALARLGRSDEARELLGLDRDLAIVDLPVPPGYANGMEFRAALAEEIRINPTLVADPPLKATRGGLRTRQLCQPTQQAIPALLAEVEAAVQGYAARLSERGGRFSAAIPKEAGIDPWALVYGSDGYQTPHLHPAGWLSGVYFVAAPKSAGDDHYRGALRIGPVGSRFLDEPPWGVREIEPIPGRLVLFPSYTPHATAPSRADGERIVISFDVLPTVAPGKPSPVPDEAAPAFG